MAEERRIIVEIVSKNSEMQTNPNNPEEKKEELPGSQQSIKVKHISVDKTARSLTSMIKDRGEGLLRQSLTTTVNRYFSLSENYMAETDYSNVMTTINKGKSFVSTVKVGAAIGGWAGAAIGAAAWGVNEFVSYQSRMSNYYQNLNATNYQTQFDRSRLGLTNEGKGTEN